MSLEQKESGAIPSLNMTTIEMSRVLLLLISAIPCLLFGNLKAETASSASPAPSQSPSKVKPNSDNITFSEIFRSRYNEAFIGVVLANFISIDPDFRYVFVKPQEDNLPRMTIYIDKKTSFSTMKAGKLGKGKKDMMLEGDRVALRVFVKNGIILADEIFLVDGDFGPKARFAKRKYTAPIGAPGEAGAAKSEPAKKKSGGH